MLLKNSIDKCMYCIHYTYINIINEQHKKNKLNKHICVFINAKQHKIINALVGVWPIFF